MATNMYDFSGKLLSTYRVNHNSKSSLTPETRVLTVNEYDAAGRLTDVSKTINDDAATTRTIAHNDYDELGRLKQKMLGNGMETLAYDYNIRGWLRDINKEYAEKSNDDHYFGMELAYDYGFGQPQLNGNIAGTKWRSKGDGEQRAYGFSYDLANRLTKADFTQNNGGWNNSAGVDFSVTGLSYDANGNIMEMDQNGLKVNSSDPIDQLSYRYQSNSNKLIKVTDLRNDPGTTLGDFHDGNNGTANDYSYDGNGNLKTDANKGVEGIYYNYLNLPENITITDKGTIQYVYDASGNKLRKIVTDRTTTPNLTTTTDYINGFVYKNDTLQYFPTEEGRVRTKIEAGQPVSYI